MNVMFKKTEADKLPRKHHFDNFGGAGRAPRREAENAHFQPVKGGFAISFTAQELASFERSLNAGDFRSAIRLSCVGQNERFANVGKLDGGKIGQG
jgi:hypothetical protein